MDCKLYLQCHSGDVMKHSPSGDGRRHRSDNLAVCNTEELVLFASICDICCSSKKSSRKRSVRTTSSVPVDAFCGARTKLIISVCLVKQKAQCEGAKINGPDQVLSHLKKGPKAPSKSLSYVTHREFGLVHWCLWETAKNAKLEQNHN